MLGFLLKPFGVLEAFTNKCLIKVSVMVNSGSFQSNSYTFLVNGISKVKNRYS